MSNDILAELEAITSPVERRYFYQDNKRAIHKAFECGLIAGGGIRPAKRAWNPQERWPWLRWGWNPQPQPQPVAASTLAPLLQCLVNLPFAERTKFYQQHKTEINLEYESFREANNLQTLFR